MKLLDEALKNYTDLENAVKKYIETFPSQAAAADAIGTKQPEISAFLKGSVRWSHERLVKILKGAGKK